MGKIQLDSRMSDREYASYSIILGEAGVSCMIVLLNPLAFEVASFDKRYAPKFYSRGTCSTLKDIKHNDKFRTFYRYFISWGFLA